MRVLLDANIYASYLLRPFPGRNPAILVAAAFADTFVLLLPTQLVAELVGRVTSKPYLAQRITREDLARLVEQLVEIAEASAAGHSQVPPVVRDSKDDYLLAHAIHAHADYLVTGDDDLLVLIELEGVRIVSPAEFVALLAERGLI